MDTVTIKQEIHDYIETANDDQIEFIYAVIKDEQNSNREWWKDEALVAELNRRYDDLKSGKTKGHSLEKAMEHLTNRLK